MPRICLKHRKLEAYESIGGRLVLGHTKQVCCLAHKVYHFTCAQEHPAIRPSQLTHSRQKKEYLKLVHQSQPQSYQSHERSRLLASLDRSSRSGWSVRVLYGLFVGP
jgi:hypothetical protein